MSPWVAFALGVCPVGVTLGAGLMALLSSRAFEENEQVEKELRRELAKANTARFVAEQEVGRLRSRQVHPSACKTLADCARMCHRVEQAEARYAELAGVADRHIASVEALGDYYMPHDAQHVRPEDVT